MKKNLFLFVEGYKDYYFFSRVILPKIKFQYSKIEFIQFSNLEDKWNKIRKFISAIESDNDEYIIIVDKNDAICITDRKNKLKSKIQNIEEEKIFVVEKEIESWFLAGLNKENSEKLGIKNFTNTDNITKEIFEDLFIEKDLIPIITRIVRCF